MINPRQWSRVDKVIVMQKRFLRDSDICFYYLQKDSLGFERGPHASENQAIINFKHDPVKYVPSSPQMRYKRQAIHEFATAVASLLRTSSAALSGDTVLLVPIPTSKPRGAADYDSRLDDLCLEVEGKLGFAKYCPALDTISDKGSAHRGEVCRRPDVIMANMKLDSRLLKQGAPVVLIDDVLTTGSHFAACRDMLVDNDPNTLIVGMFLSVQLYQWDDDYSVSDSCDW